MSLGVLLIEDDRELRATLRDALQIEGYRVVASASLADARAVISAAPSQGEIDIVLLDLGLPDGEGHALLAELRRERGTPVIVISARPGEDLKVRLLDAGADDYLVKPFGAGELLARVRAQLRRHRERTPAGQPTIAFGDVAIDLVRRSVSRAGEVLRLTPIEYRLLVHLAGQPDRVLTHKQLLLAIWGPGHGEDTHYVRVHVANLRKKIERDAAYPRHLLTETGIGYRFVLG